MFFIPLTIVKNISHTPYILVHIFMFLNLKPNTFICVYKYAYIKAQERRKDEKNKDNENENVISVHWRQ